jgi:hypothetical protein
MPRIADGVVVSSGIGGTDVAGVSASNTGAVLYRRAATAIRRQLTWVDRSGKTVLAVGDPDGARSRQSSVISLSPDGRRVVVVRVIDGKADLWLVDLERAGAMSRFTFSGKNGWGLWSRDGLRLTFGSTRNGTLDIYQRATVGDRDEPLLVAPRGGRLSTGQLTGRFSCTSTRSQKPTSTCGRSRWGQVRNLSR